MKNDEIFENFEKKEQKSSNQGISELFFHF